MKPHALLPGALRSQENRLFTLHSPLPEAGLLLDRFTGTEALSSPFEFRLQLLSERADLALKDFLGKSMGVALRTASGADRHFHGHVQRFIHLGSDGGLSTYLAIVGPWLHFLKHRVNSRLFQHQNVIAIAREVFGAYGVAARWRLQLKEADYPELTMTVQYQESDLDFISRLLEGAGIHYGFEFDPDGHTLVLADETRAAPPVPGAERIAYNSLPGAAREDTIDAWTLGEALLASDFATTSYDFKNPRDRTGHSWHTHRPAPRALEHYEPAGLYGYPDYEAGERLAQLRMEQLEQRGETYSGASNVRTLTCGRSFELRDHYRKTAALHDRLFLVTSVTHTGNNNYRNQTGQADYRNTFECAPRSVRYRPPRVTPRPVIQGPQTATVVGGPGQEICTDAYGRVRIQFHWDRLGKFNDSSSAWVRVSSPMAGSRFGFIALPRVGQEVVVEFLDGNPDRPLITGALYNELNQPPWELPAHQTQSGLLTRSSKDGTPANANALRFEDKKGSEEVWLHAEKDQRIEVEHDESHSVDHDRGKRIGHDETTVVGNDRTETVGSNETIAIGQNRTESVGENEAVTIGGVQSFTVVKAQTIHVGATKTESVVLASTELVGGVKVLSVGAAYTVTVGGAKNEAVILGSFEEVGEEKRTFVGSTYSIEALDQFDIKVGESRMILTRDGTITLSGKQINIQAGGPLRLNGKNIEANQ